MQAPGLRQISVLHDAGQQQLMGSPRLQQDDLTGGPIIAPGSESNAAVQAPLADIAGGKSGTEAESATAHKPSPLGDENRQVSQQQAAEQQQQQQQPQQQLREPVGEDPGASSAGGGADKQGEDEYSEQQQSQQAGGACKQS